MFAMEDDVFRFIYYSKKHSLSDCQIRSSGCSQLPEISDGKNKQ